MVPRNNIYTLMVNIIPSSAVYRKARPEPPKAAQNPRSEVIAYQPETRLCLSKNERGEDQYAMVAIDRAARGARARRGLSFHNYNNYCFD